MGVCSSMPSLRISLCKERVNNSMNEKSKKSPALLDADLEAVSGGSTGSAGSTRSAAEVTCPFCGSGEANEHFYYMNERLYRRYVCSKCGSYFDEQEVTGPPSHAAKRPKIQG